VDESQNSADRDNVIRGSHADPATISSLIADLASQAALVRTNARQSLVTMGGPAVAPLIEALADPKRQVRWEAAKALSQIADPAAAPALVRALRDRGFGVRWLAAEGLIALGSKGLVPLLRALIEHSDSVWLLQGAHHVLHDLAKGNLKDLLQPVLASLEGVEPSLEVPVSAETALHTLARAEGRRGGR
jgi:HEAT repeat protein